MTPWTCPTCGRKLDARKPHCKPGSAVQCRRARLDFKRVRPLSTEELHDLESELATGHLPADPRVAMVRLLAMVIGKAVTP